MGTMAMFGLLSERIEFNDKIHSFVALAPIIRITNCTTPWRHVFSLMTRTFGRSNRFIVKSSFLRLLTLGKTPFHRFHQYMHFFGFSSLFGLNVQQADFSKLATLTSRPFTDMGWGQFRHFIQLYNGEQFRKYDFGRKVNWQRYGTEKPPLYNLEKISNERIALLRGANDYFVHEKDFDYLKSSLKVELIDDHLVANEKFAHLDFLMAKDSGSLVNERVIGLIKSAGKSLKDGKTMNVTAG